MFTSDHPLIGNLDDVSVEDLQSRISELYRKLGIARATGNAYLVNQIVMAINNYQTAYQNRLRQDTDGTDFNSVIDIS